MNRFEYRDSIVVAASPEQVYDVVSDISRTGEWSPICTGCWWDSGDGPLVGAKFTGHNETPERVWETRCEVVSAERGREFAWTVNHGWVRWGYTFEPVPGGTALTESWQFLPDGIAGFAERYGTDAQAQIENRTRAAHLGIPATLAAIKRVIEAG